MTISAKARTRVVVLLTSVALALVLLLAGAVAARADGPTPPPDASTQVSHTVISGDTLWEIAATHAPEGADLRDVVYDIKRLNGLDTSTIQPGQVLLIPLP